MEQSGSYGQFDLLRVFGRGQVTEVFLAREKGATGPEGLVVVHRVLESVAENNAFREAFLNEAGVAGTIKHPNIVEIFDLGEEEGQTFLAQEYVPGGSLHDLLDRSGEQKIPLGDALFIVGELCAGLQFAHAMAGPDGLPRNLVHGAVNPRHVLVSVDGVVKVTDFGMASALKVLGVAPPGDPRESEAYLAPEQIEGASVDRRADIFACGAILYRLTTGALPGSPAEGTLQPPREVNPDLPELIESMIVKAMAGRPKDRHPTCGALRRDLAKAARAASLKGDMGSLGNLVRAQFPEVVGVGDESEGAGAAAVAPATSPLASISEDAAPKAFPPPNVTEAPSVTPASPTAPTEEVIPEVDEDGVPLLADSEVEQISTGQYDALKTEKLESLLKKDADKVLSDVAALSPSEPPSEEEEKPKKRPIWLWIALAVLGGALLTGVIGVLVTVFVILPQLEDAAEQVTSIEGLEGLEGLGGEGAPSVPEMPSYNPNPGVQPQQQPSTSLAVPGVIPAQPGLTPNVATQDPDAPKPPDATSPLPGPDASPGLQAPSKAQPLATDGATPNEASVAKTQPQNSSSPPSKTAPASTSPGSDSTPAKRVERSSKTARASREGFLYVLTSPTSRVYMDSRLLGTTPIMKRAVPVGRHSLVLVSPGQPTKRVSIYVNPNKVTRVRHLFNR